MANILEVNRSDNKITLGTTGTTINVASHTASTILGLDASKDLESLAIPLIVANGGTGLATITDGGLLLGSGTGAITPLAQATNGQLPIGSTGADCVLATLTGTVKQVIVTNGAGTITLSGPQDLDTVDSPTFDNLSLGTGELTCGSINRASGTLTLEIGGTAELSLTSTLALFGGEIEIAKIKLTAIGGYAIKLTNKTGGNTVAGQLVAVYSASAIDDAFKTSAANDDGVFGVVLDAGVADGSEAWIIVSGIADVLMDGGGSARGDRIISSATAGSADVWNVGGAVATHFQEIGHCIETRTGAGLAKCVLHFN